MDHFNPSQSKTEIQGQMRVESKLEEFFEPTKEKVLVKMLNVKPTEIERFALHLLLVHVKDLRASKT